MDGTKLISKSESTLYDWSDIKLVNNHATFFNASLREMLEQTEQTDTTLVCGSRKFAAHKVILCASSPFFRTLFRSGLTQSKSGSVNLNGIASEALEIILKVMYFQPLPTIRKNKVLKSLLSAAHTLQFWCLYQHCCEEYMKKLSGTYFVEIWNTALLYENTEMLKIIPVKLAERFTSVKQSGEFLLLNLEQLKMLVGCLDVKEVGTDDVVKSLFFWVKHDANRLPYLNELFSLVDLNCITATYLSSLLNNEEVIKLPIEVLTKVMSVAASRMALACQDPAKAVSIQAPQNQNSKNHKPKLLLIGGYAPQSLPEERGNHANWLYDKQYQFYDMAKRTWSVAMIFPSKLLDDGATMAINGDFLYIIANQLPKSGARTASKTSIFEYRFFSSVPPIERRTLETLRTSAGTAVLDGHLYIVGGKDMNGQKLSSVERYNILQNKCVSVPPMPRSSSTQNVAATAGCLFVVDFEHSSLITQFDPKAMIWCIILTRVNAPSAELYKEENMGALRSRVAVWNQTLFVLRENGLDVYSATGQFVKSIHLKKSYVAVWGTNIEIDEEFNYLYLLDVARRLYRFHPKRNTIGALPGSTRIEDVLCGGLTTCP